VNRAASRHPTRPRRDWRTAGLGLTLAAVLLGGWLIDRSGAPTPSTIAATPAATPAASLAPRLPHQAEVQRHFDQAVVMLHARQYEHAATALHHVLQLAPTLPEAHVNMGYAMLGLKRPQAARDFFDSATALKPDQANAYYGLALAWEAAGDLPMATGAMRSYLHLARAERPEHLSRARAALWEWEQARKPAAGGQGAEPRAAR
jgi:tetratricopeptide (TPR) repeat protein